MQGWRQLQGSVSDPWLLRHPELKPLIKVYVFMLFDCYCTELWSITTWNTTELYCASPDYLWERDQIKLISILQLAMLTSSLVPFQFLCQLWISFALLFGNGIKCWWGNIYFRFPKSLWVILRQSNFFGVQVPDINCSSYGAWSHPRSYFNTAAFLLWLDKMQCIFYFLSISGSLSEFLEL